jgi:thioredoxin reductase (NADPH)
MQKTKLVIIGSGPAGYTAAIYAARADLAPVLLTGIKSGGQLMLTTKVENFPGFPEGVMGPKLMMEMRKQAEYFGTELIDDMATAVDFSTRPFKIWTQVPAGRSAEEFESAEAEKLSNLVKKVPSDYEAEAVIISTGAASVRLGIPGEAEFLGRGVATCAVCDAAFYRDKVAAVVGGGDSAMEDSLALAKFAKQVYLIHRRDQLRASKIMQERVLDHPKIKILWNSQVVEIKGDKKVESILVRKTNLADNNQTVEEIKLDGVFAAIGHNPVTHIFSGQLLLDDHGYIVTRQTLTKQGLKFALDHIDSKGLLEYPTMTSVDGIFAAGDVVDVRYQQAITSAGQGCQAALDAEKWLEAYV